MKIFIFKPSDDWRCCGGGRVVVAKDIAEVEIMFGDDSRFHKTQDDIPESSDDYDQWVLVETLPTDKKVPRIILNDYNWA